MVRTEHLGRYKDLAFLLTRYGLKDFRLELDPVAEPLPADDDKPVEPDVQARAEAFSTRLITMRSMPTPTTNEIATVRMNVSQ